MKRNLIFVVVLFFTGIRLFAFDLYSGLDTTMTKAQIEAKAQTVLKAVRPS
ncbi:MAG: hypothetical protein LBD48_05680 [Treponema sp.]|nr:hypothetical protein [Treponema sp.]